MVASSQDPFAQDDPVDALRPRAGAGADAEDDFDALGFDTSFGGETPGASSGFGLEPMAADAGLSDQDATPPAGIYIGEEVSVLDASSIGRALAEAEGRTLEQLPDFEVLQQGLIGIDIGASVGVVARFNRDGKHEVVPNQDDDLITPGQIFFDDDGERIVGREARLMAASAPQRAVVDLKAVIADPDFKRHLGAQGEVAAVDVLAIFLQRLVSDVEAHSGERPTHVSLAAPAWYSEAHKELLARAVAAAGMELVGITDEALSAAVPYSLRLPDLKERRALVVDLGHAALGVAVVRCVQGDIQVLAKSARRELGSSQWDRLLAQEAARKFREIHKIDPLEDERAAVDLELRAEDAKRELSRRPHCTLVVSAGGKSLKIGFKREGFEKAARSLLEGIEQLLSEVREQAGIADWKDLDALIMTGGGSRTPAVRRLVAQETGMRPERGISPEDVVAVGSLYWGIGERHRRRGS